MLFGLLRREKERAAPEGVRLAQPAVEALEARWVPAAIRIVPGLTANSLAANNNGSTGLVNVGFGVSFYGTQATQLYVNNNGNVTFGQPLAQFTPNGLNSSNGGIPIIAPFFANVDTRGTSSQVTYGTGVLCGHRVFGVDWVHVNYFDATAKGHVDKFNNSQLILIDRSDTGAGNFDIEFNYDTINWETGDANGGTNGLGGQSAHAGYSAGTGAAGTFFELPGSGVNGALLDGGPDALATSALNADTPGRLHFFVRGGQVEPALDIGKGAEITNLVNTFHPFRYIFNQATQTYRGNLTVLNSASGAANLPGAIACLDETTSGTTALAGTFPITVVYQNLPPGVTLLNATGQTASGKPYITTPGPVPFAPGQVVRIPVLFADPLNLPISTFLEGPGVQVVAGQFDPTRF
jgi:hypothetical protein